MKQCPIFRKERFEGYEQSTKPSHEVCSSGHFGWPTASTLLYTLTPPNKTNVFKTSLILRSGLDVPPSRYYAKSGISVKPYVP